MQNTIFSRPLTSRLAASAFIVLNVLAVPSQAGTLLQFDFNGANPWPQAAVKASRGAAATTSFGPIGTIDEAKSTQASGGLLLAAGSAPDGAWTAGVVSGPLPVRNTEKELGKLTLSFSLSASLARPVAVRLESLDANKQRTGGLETLIYPAAPDFYQRYALDLSTMKPAGAGAFDPAAPFVQVGFEIGSAGGWPGAVRHELRVDNVHYASPAFYVSAGGSNQNDGRTEATAFATPQKAVDAAGPGDIIVVMNGTYQPVGAQAGIVRFRKTGTPAGWISLKNYPGHKPLFAIAGAWAGIRILRSAQEAAAAPAAVVPSYIEVRGLHVRGEGDVAKTKYPDKVGQAAPETNGNAISVQWDARPKETIPHHLRFADNLIEYCPGGGIGPGAADWVTIENNVVRNNCWTTIYATSGISLNHGSNFDGTVGTYRILIRDNVASGNRTFEKWKQIGKVSDGNGIIVDVNQDTKLPEEQRFQGRTLIQNNLAFNNGGSGIHAFKSKRVDIINNTVYLNSASPELPWGQLFVQASEDVSMINNIVVAPPDQPVNTAGASRNDQNSKNIVRAHNLYFGGGTAPLMGEGDIIADPQFVHPSIDENVADFHLKPGSPATGRGRAEAFTPLRDLDGKPRGATPTIGAYQIEGAPSSVLASQPPGTPALSPAIPAASAPSAAPPVAPVVAQAGSGTLLQLDFNGPNPWPQATADVMPSTPIDVATSVEAKAVGTIDMAGATAPSGGMLLKTDVGEVNLPWSATYSSGLMAVRNTETNPGKLTLSLSLSASGARPVVVRIESFDAKKIRTGGLETTIYPAAPNFHQRYALDLSAMSAAGAGRFSPTDPHIQLTFVVASPAWPDKASHELRIDNVQYARPAFYVSPQGSDKNDGRTEATAFARPQKALDAAQPGDIVVLMNGTYQGGLGGVASFPRAGTPAAWIVLKNYPGHKPTLTSNGWNIVSISKGSKAAPFDGPALAYLEVRGLHIRGESDVVKEKFPDAIGKADGRSNGNGIAADGRHMKNGIHHLRFADNFVEYCPGQGLGTLESDWVSIENNVSRNNCWTTIYGTSGISTLGAFNFDASDNVYKILIRNNISSGNETRQPWDKSGKITDGNGIIIDVNQKTENRPDGSYLGRTLVQNNLCFNNGGSGVHTVRANRVDIINNTTYLNSASKSLEYSQIYTYSSDDVRIINNILVAPVADVAAGEKPEAVNKNGGKNTNVVFMHNLYFGGNIAPVLGAGDKVGDPLFVNPSRDPKVADFHLKPGSPALRRGRLEAFSPFLDLDGKPRGAQPNLGAY